MQGDFRTIPLTKGLVALVSLEDYDRISQYKWFSKLDYTTGKYYAARVYSTENGPRQLEMQRQVLGLEYGDKRIADHIEPLKTLDNRRSNLRLADKYQNQQNRRATRRNTTGFKGVYRSRSGSYFARIKFYGKEKHLGTRSTAEEASALYRDAALLLHGDFARTV